MLVNYKGTINCHDLLMSTAPFSQRRFLQSLPCSSCGKSSLSIICKFCNEPRPFDLNKTLSPFDVFGIEEKFDINISNVEDTARIMQKRLHPDILDMEKELQQWSPVVSTSLKKLKNPVNRAELLLDHVGYQTLQTEDKMQDMKFLEDAFLLVERIENIFDQTSKLNRNSTDIQKNLVKNEYLEFKKDWEGLVSGKMRILKDTVTALIEENKAYMSLELNKLPCSRRAQKAKEVCGHLRLFSRIFDQIGELEDALGELLD